MIRALLCLMLMAFPFSLTAHEMLPTYPKFTPAYIKGLYETNIRMFNKRKDAEYFEISVWDEDWNPIPFATSTNVVKIPHLGRVQFDVYVRAEDLKQVEYICSKSKLNKESSVRTAVVTRVCSKVR